MSKSSTCRGDTSRNPDFLDTFPEHVPAVDMFPAELHVQPVRRSLGEGGFAESAKLEHLSAEALAKVEAIKANRRGLGYGE